MKPIDYIYKNLHCFNLSIFKRILAESGEEVSESIYDYLMETTWNTNPTFLKQFGLDIVRTKEESGTDGARYVIRLAQYGTGMEVYAEDSPWKPTVEEFEEAFNSIVLFVLQEMGYESIEDVPLDEQYEASAKLMTELNNQIHVYSLKGNQLNFIDPGTWCDITKEEYNNDVTPSEGFTTYGSIEYRGNNTDDEPNFGDNDDKIQQE